MEAANRSSFATAGLPNGAGVASCHARGPRLARPGAYTLLGPHASRTCSAPGVMGVVTHPRGHMEPSLVEWKTQAHLGSREVAKKGRFLPAIPRYAVVLRSPKPG